MELPVYDLNDGTELPVIGFGTTSLRGAVGLQAMLSAIEVGYRLLDTAVNYGNEMTVGEAVRRSAVPRTEFRVTSKLPGRHHAYDDAVVSTHESLRRLGVDHVDLYLIHWPRPRDDRYVETWRAFEKALAEGKTRSIGVSNFTVAHLERLAKETETVPAVNQVELHPRFAQTDLRAYHAEHGIATEAWSPIGQGKGLLDDPVLVGLAQKYGKTPAQVVLRWHVQLDNIVFPKSMHPERMRENIDVFDFELAGDDVQAISALDRGTAGRLGPNPDTFG
jgi:2,5-diketo-D-gluconate reductase A